jgi:formylglycine-generating enzyme required for sulfatase activity/Cdc6-like AAA superfamily ATPase
MPDSHPVDIISDAPETESPVFGFDAYARTIAGLIANKGNKTPLVIGIYGLWGTGKTTLMKTVKRFLETGGFVDKAKFRKCKTVWFQAWKYGKEDEILAALIEEIFKTMAADNFFENCKAEIEKLTKKLDKSKIIGSLSKLFTGIDVTEFFSDLEYRDKLGFYDTFQNFFDDLLWTYLNWRPKISGSEAPDDEEGALVVFIDDLDRCPEQRIIKVLETIKLFMDKEGCIFVIGAANDIIEKALASTYGEKDAARFMEKIVQVTFKLPPIPTDDFKPLVKKINPRILKDLTPHLDLIMPAMHHNPRQLKRFLNNLNLLEGLLKNSGVEIDFNYLLFWNIIDHIYPELGDEIKDRYEILYILQDHIRALIENLGEERHWDIPQETLQTIPKSFHGYVQNKQLVDIINQFTIERSRLQRLLTMSGIVESTEDVKEEKSPKEYPTGIGDMVDVPAGDFPYGDDKKTVAIKEPFKIDIYPVTNRQFKAFIDAGGYNEDGFWSKEGRTWRNEEKVTLPRYWKEEKWNQPEHPVVGVSYYEAQAFARWAGKELPTEQQWERVARGIDGREYPWEGGFDKEKCNTMESGIGKTTRVTRYPNGISPVGCYDMAGNVWEWTQSFYDKDRIVLRGGSWDIDRGYARCADRIWDSPSNRYDFVGFRCVRTLK